MVRGTDSSKVERDGEGEVAFFFLRGLSPHQVTLPYGYPGTVPYGR